MPLGKGRAVSNFAFVGAADWPEIHTDCARAKAISARIRGRHASTIGGRSSIWSAKAGNAAAHEQKLIASNIALAVPSNESGWPPTDARHRGFEVTGMPGGAKGYVDYVLWGTNGVPLSVVETKRSSKSPHLGISEGLLAPAVGISCGTRFLQQGIRFVAKMIVLPRPTPSSSSSASTANTRNTQVISRASSLTAHRTSQSPIDDFSITQGTFRPSTSAAIWNSSVRICRDHKVPCRSR
jgi:hypothetical protein